VLQAELVARGESKEESSKDLIMPRHRRIQGWQAFLVGRERQVLIKDRRHRSLPLPMVAPEAVGENGVRLELH
jgi:hypothetical protein